MEPVAYEGHGAGALFPPSAAPDPSYPQTSYDTTGAWYGYGGVAAEQTGAWAVGDGWQQQQYPAAYGHGGYDYEVGGGACYPADPTATVSWGTAAFTAPDATGQYSVQDLYAATGYPDTTTIGHGYQQYAGYDPAPAAEADYPYAEQAPQQAVGDAQPYEDAAAGHPVNGEADPSDPDYEAYAYEYEEYAEDGELTEPSDEAGPDHDDRSLDSPVVPAGRAATRAAARVGRPRTARRTALLTIAVPSVAVMGVAAAAAVTVSVPDQGHSHETAAGSPDTAAATAAKAASSKLDSQLAGLRKNADDFAGRVSRNQARIDLKARQAAERKRREALRPKFVLPVTERGLSATFGMAGTHWAALHTGIDFPVSWGTSVHAATDGTVRTQWNSAYGYMAIVTASDGTETWYCHLSSYKIRSGKVKAGDTIAYSGSSGNSTGPHLHFEVHPGGEGTPAVDPIPWLLSHGLDPR